MSDRPRTRAECINGPRPCPWLTCKYHLAIDISDAGHLLVRHKSLRSMTASCTLDVADSGEHSLIEIGDLLNISKQGVAAIENLATRKLKKRPAAAKLYDES